MADNQESGARPKTMDTKEARPKGPTLSTSTSSFEALDPHDPQLNHLATVMFSKSADWIQGELTSTVEDYKLLEKMNKATSAKYSDMVQITASISKELDQLNNKYKELQPHLDEIDQLAVSTANLEQAAYKLDAFSKKLEAVMKTLEKRSNS